MAATVATATLAASVRAAAVVAGDAHSYIGGNNSNRISAIVHADDHKVRAKRDDGFVDNISKGCGVGVREKDSV
jgi:hypothetical protein